MIHKDMLPIDYSLSTGLVGLVDNYANTLPILSLYSPSALLVLSERSHRQPVELQSLDNVSTMSRQCLDNVSSMSRQCLVKVSSRSGQNQAKIKAEKSPAKEAKAVEKPAAKAKRRRKVSSEARARMAAAAKKRWAEKKAA